MALRPNSKYPKKRKTHPGPTNQSAPPPLGSNPKGPFKGHRQSSSPPHSRTQEADFPPCRGLPGPETPRALGRPGTLEVRPRSRPPLGRHPILGAVSSSPRIRREESRALIGRHPFRHSQRTPSLFREGRQRSLVPYPSFPKTPVASGPEHPRCGARL